LLSLKKIEKKVKKSPRLANKRQNKGEEAQKKPRNGKQMSKNRNDDTILQALLSQRTVREAAEAANVSERTIYTRLADPAFRGAYNREQDDILRGVSNHLKEHLRQSIACIVDIMEDADNKASERLTAARMILEYSAKFAEIQNITERLTELELKIVNNVELTREKVKNSA